MGKKIEGDLCTWQNMWGDCWLTTNSPLPSLFKLKETDGKLVKDPSHEVIRTIGYCSANNPEEQRQCTRFLVDPIL